MGSEYRVASLTGIFKSEPAETTDGEKLLDLYWNRAALKKEFAVLRDEKYRLQDSIKQHEGAVARAQQQMKHLESLLLDPEWAHNVVVFYQLRRLASHCQGKLERFAEQLKQQREQRVHRKVLGSWKEKCNAEAELIEKRIGERRMQIQLLEDHLQSERHKLMTMNGIARLFRGRGLAAEIAAMETCIEAERQQENHLLLALETLHNLEPPDYQGLDIAEKRSINFMILSLAQQLYLYFSADNLATMAKEASEKSVGAINYGSKYECDNLVELLEQRWESMEKVTDAAEILHKRAKMIAEHAEFRHDDDAIPVPGTVATVYSIDENGVIAPHDANLLGENYFGIAKVLSR